MSDKHSLWVKHRVDGLFVGRKGHGGGQCTRRVLRPQQLRDLLQEAFDRGQSSSKAENEQLKAENERLKKQIADFRIAPVVIGAGNSAKEAMIAAMAAKPMPLHLAPIPETESEK